MAFEASMHYFTMAAILLEIEVFKVFYNYFFSEFLAC